MMATTTFTFPAGNSEYFLPPRAATTTPSPPEDFLHGKSAYGAPMAQTPPSANISPTSLLCSASHLNVRQLRQPRQPLYIPAALRPTDPRSRPQDIPGRHRAPPTPPASKDNSFDSAKSLAAPSLDTAGLAVVGAGEADGLAILRRGVSRAASDGLDEQLGQVTGPPTTAHWKPDVSSNACALCHSTFTWFFRRHHCRSCGEIVCDTHIKKIVPLDQNARYHPTGTPSKACDVCWREWNVVRKLRRSRTSSMADSQTSAQGTPVPGLPIPQQPKTPNEFRVGSLARSEGMVWSTF